MHPVAFRIMSLEIRWYGICVATGVIAAYWLMQKNRKYADASSEQVADICFTMVIAGIIGARIFYVIEFFRYFKYTVINGVAVRRSVPSILLEMIRIDHGGLVFYGGFICAVATLIFYCRKKKLQFLKIGDIVAPALAFGHAFGRIGCLINGCCYGTISSWGISYPAIQAYQACAGTTRQPVQLYESISNFILAGFLCFMLRRLKPGQTAALYFITYGTIRFCLEFLRGDNTDFAFGIFSPGQTVGLFVIPIGIIAFILLGRRKLSEDTDNMSKAEQD